MDARLDNYRWLRTGLMLAAIGMLSGCSVWKWFESDEKKVLEPAALVDFEAEIKIRKEWKTSIGDGQGKQYLRLQPALYGDLIIAASVDGEVYGVDAATGKRRWDVDLDIELSGGVGAGGDLAIVGTTQGDVIALETGTGREVWRAKLSSEVLAPPAADWDVVVVQTLDGHVTGLDTSTGKRRWNHETSMPLLTLRGTAPPVLVEGVVYAAQANGRITAIRVDSGTELWDGRVATAQGQSEIDRAVDVDGKPLLIGQAIYAVSYQGKLAGLNLANGRTLWARDASSYQSIAEGFGNLYVAEVDGTVSAYEVNGGAVRWRNDQLQRRQLSAPASFGSYVVVADMEGYVHFLSQVDGHFMGRVRADADGVRADMIASGDHLYVYCNDGELIAYSVAKP